MDNARNNWDAAQAARLYGTVILVGITYTGPGTARQEQFFGTVTHVDAAQGITLRLLGKRAGETFVLPPDLDALHPAQPGSYRLRQTGEIVVDPDFITTWVSSPGKPDAPPPSLSCIEVETSWIG